MSLILLIIQSIAIPFLIQSKTLPLLAQAHEAALALIDPRFLKMQP